MKTIALAANGEGFGHASRMINLIQGLQGKYNLVLYIPQTIENFIREKLMSADWHSLKVRIIPCFQLAKQNDAIKYFRTVKRNLPLLFSLRTSIARIKKQLGEDAIDALISDFEPLTSFAARALNIYILQINHPGIVLRSSSIRLDALFAKFTAMLMMGVYDKRLLVSFYNGEIGPLIRHDISSSPKVTGTHIVVYVKKEYRKAVIEALEKNQVADYRVYPDFSEHVSYEESLVSCRAVISSAGHQTLSECLYLGKPVLAIPQRGQFEQHLNARMIEACGCGLMGNMFAIKRKLARFIENLNGDAYTDRQAIPWVSIKTDDWSERLISKIVEYVENERKAKIIPFSSHVLASWLSDSQPYKAVGGI